MPPTDDTEGLPKTRLHSKASGPPGRPPRSPFEVVEPRASYVDSVKARRFILRDEVWDLPGVRDAASELKAAELST